MKTFGNSNREAGILMPVSMLNGPHGIGDFGECARHFLKTTSKAGFHIWQILPLNPLGYGNSPYQPYSSFAGDPIYISLDDLVADGLLKEVPHFNIMNHHIDYEAVRAYKEKYLHEAYKNFTKNDDYEAFVKRAFWLRDYAEFMTRKKNNQGKPWSEWTDLSVDEEDVMFIYFEQYLFDKQWAALKDYAHGLGLVVMGDMPIYVGLDSADVYGHKECFLLDEEGHPTSVAGVPPDYFSADGQLWGNPIYDWDYLKAHDYSFWMERLSWNKDLFDVIRIDHFRAFDTYWKVPAGEKTARNGKWILGPSYDFFDAVFKKYPDLNVVAEDLGDLRAEVLELKDHYHMLGMRIVEYSFGPDEEKLNFKLPEFAIAYTGTHDNAPVNGWYAKDLSKKERRRLRKIMSHYPYHGTMCQKLVRFTLDSPCVKAILPMWDILGLGYEGRINTPGTIGEPNWCYKLNDLKEYDRKVYRIHDLLEKSDRL
jgi:4-alpha-glucanotransferase